MRRTSSPSRVLEAKKTLRLYCWHPGRILDNRKVSPDRRTRSQGNVAEFAHNQVPLFRTAILKIPGHASPSPTFGFTPPPIDLSTLHPPAASKEPPRSRTSQRIIGSANLPLG